MSETSKVVAASSPQRNKLVILLITAAALLGLGYMSGYFILPGMIRSAYGDEDCASVLSRHELFSGMYPFAIANETDAGLIKECAIYTLAITNEESESWRDSYNAFRVYSEAYPDGLFTDIAHEHSASVLMALINEDVKQEKFSEANAGLDNILENYGDTPSAADAEKLKSDLRMAFGRNLRAAGNFPDAERLFQEINGQAQENNQVEDGRSAQLELSQTYLDWGLELQSEEKFAEAKAKFDIAASTDPDPSSESGTAAQAKARLAGLYVQWGDYLLTQNDFANAMQLYKTAAAFSESDDPASAGDLIANGYVQWAVESIDRGDYLGALVLLDFAQESSGTDSARTLVEETQSDLFLAFSQSDGEQAQKAIENAVRIVCIHHIQPRLPIFGLDDENIRAGVDGTGEPLPVSIAATTPASLHFAACIEEDTRVVGTLTLPISTLMFGGPRGTVQITYSNFQYFWNVVLRNVETGEVVEESVIDGEEPAALVDYNIDARTFNYFGAKPKIMDLADWILTVLE